MLGKAVVQDAAHAAGRKRQNLILQELFEIDGLAAVLIRDDDDVVLADDPFADIRMLDVSRYEGEVAAVTQHPFHQPVWTEGGTVFNLNRDLGVLVAVACEYFGEDGDRDRLKRSDVYTDALNLLCSIPGIDVTAAAAIIAEIGTDMSSFPDSQHICSWVGLSPGNNESAGKRKSVHINKGNPYLKNMLCEVAWIMASHRKLYLSGWYWKVKQRKGAKRATIALARKILSIIYTMPKTGTPYNEECFEQRRLRCERKRANRLVNELQKLGYVVVAPD